MILSFRVAAAAIVLSCLPGAVFARSRDTGRQPVTVRVSHAGLNLATVSGRAAFASRVRRAADRACPMHEAGLAQRADGQRCMHEMMDDAAMQVAALNARSGVQLASAAR